MLSVGRASLLRLRRILAEESEKLNGVLGAFMQREYSLDPRGEIYSGSGEFSITADRPSKSTASRRPASISLRENAAVASCSSVSKVRRR